MWFQCHNSCNDKVCISHAYPCAHRTSVQRPIRLGLVSSRMDTAPGQEKTEFARILSWYREVQHPLVLFLLIWSVCSTGCVCVRWIYDTKTERHHDMLSCPMWTLNSTRGHIGIIRHRVIGQWKKGKAWVKLGRKWSPKPRSQQNAEQLGKPQVVVGNRSNISLPVPPMIALF